jgi:hypothetical protein
MRKFTQVFLLFTLLFSAVFNLTPILKKNRQNALVSRALYEVVEELFISREISFEIIIFGDVSFNVGDKIDNLVRKIGESQSIKITRHKDLNEIDNTAVVFVSPKLIKRINSIRLKKILQTPNKILFFLDRENMIDLNLLKEDLKHSSKGINQYAYYLLDSSKKVELMTFEWWTEKACNQAQIVTVNTLDKQSSKWRQKLKIQEAKFMNYHGCTLKSQSVDYRVKFTELAKYYGLKEFDQSVYDKVEKFQDKIAKLLAEQGNFSIIRSEYDIFKDDEQNYVFYQTAQNLNNDVPHLESGCSVPYYDNILLIIYSPPDPYTNYEKMVLPFDASTWMYLLITFSIFLVSISVLLKMSREIQNIAFGTNVHEPIFNVIRGIFGISQTILPENFFARFTFVLFVLFCLIFRTAYQGKFYEFNRI